MGKIHKCQSSDAVCVRADIRLNVFVIPPNITALSHKTFFIVQAQPQSTICSYRDPLIIIPRIQPLFFANKQSHQEVETYTYFDYL